MVFKSPSIRTRDASPMPPGWASMKASTTVGSAAMAGVIATPMPDPKTTGARVSWIALGPHEHAVQVADEPQECRRGEEVEDHAGLQRRAGGRGPRPASPSAWRRRGAAGDR